MFLGAFAVSFRACNPHGRKYMSFIGILSHKIGPTNSMEFLPSIFAGSYNYAQNRLLQKMHEIARWWFQTFFFSSLPGEMIQFHEHIFQMVLVQPATRLFPHLCLGGFE